MSQTLQPYSFTPIVSTTGANYGFEITAVAQDHLDALVDTQVSTSPQSLKILDIGGASGFRAEQMASHGHAVTVVDICNHAATINLRNAFNAQRQEPITFYQADAAQLQKLEPVVSEKWQLIHARRLLHWMPFSDVSRIITFMPQIAAPGCHVALCFQTNNETSGTRHVPKTTANNFYHHAPQDVLKLMRKAGYKILEHGRGPRQTSRSYKIFAQINPTA